MKVLIMPDGYVDTEIHPNEGKAENYKYARKREKERVVIQLNFRLKTVISYHSYLSSRFYPSFHPILNL